MQPYIFWFVAAFALIAAELMTGTLYLLVVGLGVAAGGVIALVGLGFGWQLLVAAAAVAAGIGVLKALKLGPNARHHKASRNLDVGQSVEVVERRPDGSLRVNYRGSQWDAQLDGEPYVAGPLYIRETRGSTLILATSKP